MNKQLLEVVESLHKKKIHTRYHNAQGTRLPGSTTIIGLRDKSGALMHWAWKLGTEGKDYRAERDEAANIGSIGHGMIKIHLNAIVLECMKDEGEAIDLYTKQYARVEVDKAENAYISYLDWEKAYNVKPILIEAALVSEKEQFGGTIDLYAEVGPDRSRDLVDFKTSKAIYPEMRIQASSYKHLLIENGYPVDRVHILKIGKEDGVFNHEPQDGLVDQWEWFRRMRRVYEVDRKVFKK